MEAFCNISRWTGIDRMSEMESERLVEGNSNLMEICVESEVIETK